MIVWINTACFLNYIFQCKLCSTHYSTHNIGEISCPICTSQSALLPAGIIPTVVLLLAQVATGVVAVLVTRHCYKKTSQKSSPSKDEHIYEQVEG